MNGTDKGILAAAVARNRPGSLAYRQPTAAEREIARGELPEWSDFAVLPQGPEVSIHAGERQ
jgi:hypothetical protein